MTAALGILLTLAGLAGGWLFGIAALGAALWIFAAGLGLSVSVAQGILLAALLLMVPAAAWLAGALLDCFAWRTLHGGAFRGIAVGFACFAALRSGLLVSFVEAAFGAAQSATRPLLLLAAAVNATLLCAALTALCIMIVQLVIELPFRWLQRAARVPLVMPFAALRPLLAAVALTLLVQQIAGLFAAELRPERVLQLAASRAANG